jgi:dihydrofolate reductase
MGMLTLVENLTLDGVMQAPGRPDEDTRDGFAHGGWARAFQDPVIAREMGKRMAVQNGSLLFGRRTYEDFAGYWPKQTGNPFTPVLDARRKYVASTTLTEPLSWQNSVLLAGDAAVSVAKLKAEIDDDLGVLGSGDLCRTLIRHGLVDRFTLLIYPIVLGTGRRLFTDGAPPDTLRLVESVSTSTGVLIATYVPAGR